MASIKRFSTILLTTAGCAALAACGADSTAQLQNPGNTGSNPGVSSTSSTGGSTTTSSTGGTTASCPTNTTVVTVGTEQHCRLPARINGALTLAPGNIYQMNDRVDVGSDVTAGGIAGTLTILPGTTIYASNTNAYLVVNKGSQIVADGNATQPIIFTSAADLGYASALGLPSRTSYRGPTRGDGNGTTRGEWGGIVINGRAPTNNPTRVGEGSTGTITGGTLADDNSGTIRYVQVRYAGFDVGLQTGGAVGENELNGIAFQAVGSGTTVDYVQVHQAYDDCFEFFGGTVNAKHLVCDGSSDDSFDWTDGYVGNLQFLLSVQNPNNVTGDNCIEADNLSSSNEAAPRSNPTISNLTCVGTSGSTGITASGGTTRFRAGTAVKLYNTIIARSRIAAFEIDGSSSYSQATGANAGGILLRSIYITSDIPLGVAAEDAGLSAFFTAQSVNNLIGNNAASTLTAPVAGAALYINGTSETARPAFTLPAGFFTTVNYVGAVPAAGGNWTLGWTEFLNRGS